MGSISREQLESWVKNIELPANSNVLDIGGSQLPVSKRLGDKGEGSKFTILDLEVPHICEKEPDICFDLNDEYYNDEEGCNFQKYKKYVEYFDIAFALEISEYLWNPFQALKNISFFLKEGGLLYISFHFVYPVHNPPDEDCLRYTPLGAKKLLENAGFKIMEETPRIAEQPDLLRVFYSNERMRPSKIWINHSQVGSLIKAKNI